MATDRAEREARLKRGDCADCGKFPHVPGIKTCAACRIKQAERNKKAREANPQYFQEAARAREAEHRAAGKCLYCEEKVENGSRCTYHAALNRDNARRFRAKKAA